MYKVFKLMLALLTLASLAIAQPEWVVNITLTKGTTTIPLVIGGAATASDAFDAAFDILSPPPPPSTTDYFAYFEIIDPLFTMLTRDVRRWVAPYTSSIEWKIKILNSGGAQTTFSWNTAEVPTQEHFYLNGVDMRTSSMATFSGDGTVFLRFGQMASRSFALKAGWNMVSINYQPQNTQLTTMLAELGSALLIMKSGTGQVYWPALGIDQIINWDVLKGYQIYMSSAGTLNVLGTPVVPQSTPISLIKGWNLVSYLRDGPQSIVTSLAGIAGNLTIAKNGAGQVYWPALGINGIGNLEVGQGYQLYLTAAATLTYPANTLLARESVLETRREWAPQHYSGATALTGNSSILLVQSAGLQDGDEIGVWANGRLVGAGVAQEQQTLLTIWGDDLMTAEHDGAATGEMLTLSVWSEQLQKEQELTIQQVTDALSGLEIPAMLTYQQDGVWIVEASNQSKLPQIFDLMQNYPNPFNPITSIRFALPQEASLELAIYNVAGEKIGTLFEGRKNAGWHQLNWEARKEDGSAVPSGIYWLVLRSDGLQKQIKMTLVK